MHDLSYSNIANSNNPDKTFLFNFRKHIISTYHETNSYRKTANILNINPKTVAKWVKRYKLYGLDGLNNKSRKPNYSPNKIPAHLEDNIIFLRKQTNFGAYRLKYEFDLPSSPSTIYRVLKQHNLINTKRKKHHKKLHLKYIKQHLKPMHLFQMDTKFLDDIPNYYPYYKKHNLPKYQITIRDVSSGALFFFFSYEKSTTSSIFAVKLLFSHLKKHNINLKDVIIQVDNGTEFSGTSIHHKRGFKHFIESTFNASVRYIPTRTPNANAFVESSHRLIEDEFYSLESFNSFSSFIKKATSYHLYFNFFRYNSYKNFKSPADIIKQHNLDESIAYLPPIILDKSFDIFLNLDCLSNPMYNNLLLYHHVPDHPVNLFNQQQRTQRIKNTEGTEKSERE